VNVITRNFGTLVILAIVGGAAAGVVMARKSVQVDLGTVAGHKLALTTASKTPTGPQIITGTSGLGAVTGAPSAAAGGAAIAGGAPPAGAGNAAAAFGGGLGLARPTTGTVDKVDGKVITVIGSDGTTVKATVGATTTISSNAVITVADLKVGDAVTVVGLEASDASVITATQVTVGAGSQAAPLAGSRPGGAGVAAGAGVTGTTGGGRQGGTGAASGAFANIAVVSGAIQKINGNTLTVKTETGETATIAVAPDTRIRKVTTATLPDITYGAQVTIVGQPGADGTVAALSVQLGSLR